WSCAQQQPAPQTTPNASVAATAGSIAPNQATAILREIITKGIAGSSSIKSFKVQYKGPQDSKYKEYAHETVEQLNFVVAPATYMVKITLLNKSKDSVSATCQDVAMTIGADQVVQLGTSNISFCSADEDDEEDEEEDE